jgi:hypothetical protein
MASSSPLELASGYFEQGRPTLCRLDKGKQALVIDLGGFADAHNLRGLVLHAFEIDTRPWLRTVFCGLFALNPRDARCSAQLRLALCQQSKFPESFKPFTVCEQPDLRWSGQELDGGTGRLPGSAGSGQRPSDSLMRLRIRLVPATLM